MEGWLTKNTSPETSAEPENYIEQLQEAHVIEIEGELFWRLL